MLHSAKIVTTLLVIVLVGSAACRAKEPRQSVEPAPPTETPEPPRPVGEHLRFSEVKLDLAEEGNDDIKKMTISADGKVMIGDEEMATIAKYGDLSVDGKVVANLAADGTVTFTETEKTLMITEAGEIKEGDTVMIMWNEDGTLGGEAAKEMKGLSAKYEGAPEMRRVTSYAFLVTLLASSKGETVEEVELIEGKGTAEE